VKISKNMRRIEEQRFEFILYINDHIICQRYFNIRGFNEDSLQSLDLKDLVDEIAGMNNGRFGAMGLIPSFLKLKSREYMWKYYNPHKAQEESEIPRKDIREKNDNFIFEIKVDKKSVIKRQFTGDYFPPRVKYQVNIKEIIPDIISVIRDGLSKNKYVQNDAVASV
jgi:hypothetical protein